MKPTLSRVDCTYGSPMGRSSYLPADKTKPIKLHLLRLRFTDGCYDQGGAYWGGPANLYWAVSEDETPVEWPSGYNAGTGQVELFVRAGDREEAKAKVLEDIPNARFYR